MLITFYFVLDFFSWLDPFPQVVTLGGFGWSVVAGPVKLQKVSGRDPVTVCDWFFLPSCRDLRGGCCLPCGVLFAFSMAFYMTRLL